MGNSINPPGWPERRPPYGEFGRLARGDDGRVQCHICGRFYQHLGAHSHHKHGVSADEYRTAFGLKQATKLIGDDYREKRRRAAVRQGLPQLGTPQRERIRELNAAERSAMSKAIERRVQHELETTKPERLVAARRAQGLGLGGYPDEQYAAWAAEYVEALAGRRYAYGIYTELGRRWGISGLGARHRIHTAVGRGLLAWTDQQQRLAALTPRARDLLREY